MQGSTLKKTVVGSALLSGFFYVQAGEVEAALGSQELKLGMNNSDVKELQDVLKEKGYFTYHTSTGYFGPITEKAVSDFQKAKGLSVTGTANAETLNALKGSAKATSTSSNTLTVGERGQAVSDVQSKLKSKGYYNYNVDGIFGPITEKAVKQFQSAKGLSVTGIVDQATENALNASTTTNKPTQEAEQTLKVGARGAEVSTVQQQLKNKGYYNYAVDGIFGPITEKAVKQFQSANGLSSTGVVDGKTKEKLSGAAVQEKKEEKATGLTIGARGSAVTALQQGLKDRGYYNYNVDGIFGSITEKAVKEFQSVVGLKVTGVADDATLDALKSRGGTKTTEPVMKVGSRGDNVSKLQQDLKTAGTFHVGVTGYFGPITEKAVKDFQRAKGLTVTGTATKETLDALSNNGPAVHPPVQDTSNDDVLKVGSKGELVVELQSKLKALGYYKGGVDGAFGPLTESAVKTFQSRNKLTANGIVDSSTWEKLKQGTSYDGGGTGDSNTGSFSVMDLIADASEFIGVPYTWGGNTPQSGFDCSGFLVYVFKKQGVSLPRTMAQMWNVTTPVSSPSVGDIVFFETYKPGASHGGIYIGNNKFIHAGSSSGVTISSMDSSYWSPRYLGAKRAH
ncbi:C40 family peptidase [Alkalihalobacillus sp. CinArs1]|uniref:C40 family peptidase n=1 Tax=Alkalihalobacillus sp. CinArs1 TaxID=2995314 RepID=UPI0022DD6D11|nr:peptidoglycan-binding protein [Alkalihalobacillus sp. CinArs1]